MTARLINKFPDDYWYDAEQKGYICFVAAELPDGRVYPLTFYDPGRFGQDAESEFASTWPYLGIPGLIILPSVTQQLAEDAVVRLAQDGYFDYFVPITRKQFDDFDVAERLYWPP